MLQCLGITKKGEQCKKMLKCEGFCHMHIPKELDDQVELIDLDDLDELVENVIISYKPKEFDDKITELNKIIDLQKIEIDKMSEICRAYNCIKRFEALKTKIKSIVTFTKNFYINDIVYDKQYHDVIKSEFGMTPYKLRDMYFQLREQRNFYAHPQVS